MIGDELPREGGGLMLGRMGSCFMLIRLLCNLIHVCNQVLILKNMSFYFSSCILGDIAAEAATPRSVKRAAVEVSVDSIIYRLFSEGRLQQICWAY
jgi:hypothetical protein